MTWLKRLRGTLGLGVVWAIGWAVVGGGIMEGLVDPNGRILDMWPQTLAVPGFISGVLFSLLLWAAEGRRRFEELQLPRFTALGALTGLLLSGAALSAGFLSHTLSLGARLAFVMAPVTLLSAGAAFGTLAVARAAERRAALAAARQDSLPSGDR
jgi:hypothetical protein